MLCKVAKKKTSSKPKKVASHPKYSEMIKDALTNLKVDKQSLCLTSVVKRSL